MPVSYDTSYPHVEPFYQDTEGRLAVDCLVENSDYAWNAESFGSENLMSHAEHSAVIGAISFLAMKAFKQNTRTALGHSAIIGAASFIHGTLWTRASYFAKESSCSKR